MKKIISLTLVLFVFFQIVPQAAAVDKTYVLPGLDSKYSFTVSGMIDEGQIFKDSPVYMILDKNSAITFNCPMDILVVGEDKDTILDFDGIFTEGKVNSFFPCIYNGSVSERKDDSMTFRSYQDRGVSSVHYINEGAKINFMQAGYYYMWVVPGMKSAAERKEFEEKNADKAESILGIYYHIQVVDDASDYVPYSDNQENIGNDEYFEEDFEDETIVAEPPYEEPVEEYPSEDGYVTLEHYDNSVISVSGITNYDESRVVMGDNIVAVCSSPVVIEAKTDLDHMAIAKLEMINGEWVEARYFDGYAVNYGDTSKNWIAGEGFENVDVDYYEFTGTEADLLGRAMTVKKGKKLSLSQPGMYTVWADGANGIYTGLTFEIGDTIASYTASKVLVDGKQIQFEAYNINDNNYFKLRDIAYALTNYGYGTNVFNVKWDGERNMINLLSNSKYDAVGGELKEGDGMNKNYKLSTSALMKDGKNVTLSAYNINDNNYFKLRDLGKLFDFNVSWDGANNCILIDTAASYIK